VETHTYVFPAGVAKQTRPDNIAKTWPGGERADFEMDVRVIGQAGQAVAGYGLTNALLAIPSVSIVMPSGDLFGSRNGIYARSLRGDERAGSFEILPLAGTPGVQENGGISLRGLSSVKKSLTPKHSFTAVFRRRYGVTKLPFPAFPDTPVQRFNALVLRGNVVDSWANSEVDWNHMIDGELRWYRARASYVRDQWMRDAQLDQGQPAGHGRFVHLYLNGYYWGLYNLVLRPSPPSRTSAMRIWMNSSTGPSRSFARISLPFFNLPRSGSAHQFIRIFVSRFVLGSNYKWTATVLDVKCNARSMRICMNISTVIWPTMSVAKATRHSRLSQGCVFNLGLSTSYQGQLPETNLDNPEVGR
jgi:hypothetical protein